jgi:hypothetical protein
MDPEESSLVTVQKIKKKYLLLIYDQPLNDVIAGAD